MVERHLLFNGAQTSIWWLLGIVAAVVAAAVLIILLMSYERRLVSRKVGWTLLALRLSVLVVLFLTLLEPVISWSLDRSRSGRVIVAIDLSESMTTIDTHASKAEKLRWARALEMSGNSAMDARLRKWIAAYEKGEEPQWVEASEAANANARQELEKTRRQYVDDLIAQVDTISRKKIAEKLLTGGSAPLLKELQDAANVDVVIFSGRTKLADPETLADELGEPPVMLRTEMSNLSEGMAFGVTSGNSEQAVLGMVLLTDGRDNSGNDPVRVAARFGYINAPVYPVVLGSQYRPKDLAVATVDYPSTAFKDDKPVLKAKIKTSGFEDEEITVILEPKGEEPVTKTVTARGAAMDVEFDLDAEELGRREYTLRMDVRDGETRKDNNSKSFAMSVVDDKVRILLVEGEARWEFRYLETAFDRDERVEVKKVVFDQPFMGVLKDTFFPRTLPLPADPTDLENSPFAEPDLIVLGDISPADLPAAGWQLLEKFVSDGGGTLVITAGKNYMPLSHGDERLERMLPIANLREVNVGGARAIGDPTERGFHLELTPDGEREVMLQFDSDLIVNRAIWGDLPGHLWGLMGEAKPGATVLARAIGADENDLEEERRSAVIVHQHYGGGQVVWIGIDSTWRWRHRQGDTYHHKFWGQLGRWAVENKAMAGNDFVKLVLPRADIQTGEDAIVEARWVRGFLRQHPDVKAKIEIYRIDKPEKPFTVLDLEADKDRPLTHKARAVALPPGDYRLRLVAPGHDITKNGQEIEGFLYVSDPQTLELLDLSANRQLLTQLADASSGRMFEADEVHKIPPLFRGETQDVKIHEEHELWDHWIVMVVFFCLLTTEWVTRKLNGLP